MNIRPLFLPDRSEIHRIVCQGDTFNEAEILVAMELVDEVLKTPVHPDYRIYTAVFPPDVVAGFICYGPIPMTDYCYDLYWVAVDNRHSKKGIGSRLVEFMESNIQKENGRHIYVDTSSTPAYKAARAFYKKNGYRKVCLLKDFYREGDHKVLFKKEL